jgi:hypothetical protein
MAGKVNRGMGLLGVVISLAMRKTAGIVHRILHNFIYIC